MRRHDRLAVRLRGGSSTRPYAARDLPAAASVHAGRPVDWHRERDDAQRTGRDDSAGSLFCVVLALAGLVLLGFTALGVVTLVRWWL